MMPSTNSPALSDVSPETTPDSADCRNCGACCASFRVSFYWAEADAIGLPEGLLEQITPWHVCMTGTNSALPRCLALTGEIGKHVVCRLYAQRPSPCREVQAGDTQCASARRRYGLRAIAIDAPPSPGSPPSLPTDR